MQLKVMILFIVGSFPENFEMILSSVSDFKIIMVNKKRIVIENKWIINKKNKNCSYVLYKRDWYLYIIVRRIW